MNLFKSRAAGDVTISRPDKHGVLRVVAIVPAGSMETLRDEPAAKRGPKPKSASLAYEAAQRFARSANY